MPIWTDFEEYDPKTRQMYGNQKRIDEGISLVLGRMSRTLRREETRGRIDADSYRVDKAKQLRLPFPSFINCVTLYNCIMRKSKNQEEWREIPGYEGLYKVSSYGRIIAQPRTIVCKCKDGSEVTRYYQWRYVEPKPDKRNSRYASLRDKDGNVTKISIHRLIATVFIPNPDNLPIVNHKDENPGNNRADNLEWCTNEYNLNYGTAPKRRGESISATRHSDRIAKDNARMAKIIKTRGQIRVCKKDSIFGIGLYNSIEEAKFALKIKAKDNAPIKDCLADKRESAYGYSWFYDKWQNAGKYGHI